MSIRLDEATDVYQDNSNGLGLPSANFTITCWAWMSVNRAAPSAIVSMTASSYSNWYILGAVADGTITVLTNGNTLSPNYTPGVGSWHKYALVVSGSTGTLFAASESAALAQVSSGTITTHIPQDFRIGGTPDASQWWNGRIAAVKMWSTALTQSQCATELGQFDPVITNGLLRYYKLKTADLNDYSGNGNTLAGAGTTPTTEDDPPIPDTVFPPMDTSLRGVIRSAYGSRFI